MMGEPLPPPPASHQREPDDDDDVSNTSNTDQAETHLQQGPGPYSYSYAYSSTNSPYMYPPTPRPPPKALGGGQQQQQQQQPAYNFTTYYRPPEISGYEGSTTATATASTSYRPVVEENENDKTGVIWHLAKSLAKSAGEKLVSLEGEFWRRINEFHHVVPT